MSGPCRDDVCITCADELTPVTVESLSEDGLTAHGHVDGEACEIALDLIDKAGVGDILLTHGGVALQLGSAGSPPAGDGGNAPVATTRSAEHG